MSDTPRTNFVAHETGDPEWNRRFGQGANRFSRMMSHACILERELAAVENEMVVMSDNFNCALLEAKENFEIANEFKRLMEEYRQREAAAYIALREAAGLLSTTPKFSCETPEYIMEYLLNAPRDKNGG